ncbi:MAG: hypothetical protein ACREQ5_04110, partial [Candidatus Dormibacteria bacterium]
MSTGTDVTYGTVTIASCQTLRFAQEAVYDDSGTDLLYQKFLIRVQGYIYNLRQAGAEPGPTNITPVNQANTNIAMTEVALRQLL